MFKKSGVYVGWVGFENLGDEAMYEVCRHRFPNVEWSLAGEVDYRPNASQFLAKSLESSSHIREVLVDELKTGVRAKRYAKRVKQRLSDFRGSSIGLFGGGTLINQSDGYLHQLKIVRRNTKKLVPVFGSGVASPEFWGGRREWKNNIAEWSLALAELPKVGVRGPLSRDILVDAKLSNVIVCGDPAIAFHKKYHQSSAGINRRKVLFNPGDCKGKLWGKQDDVQTSMVDAASELIRREFQVDVLPVWREDLPACRDFMAKAGLPAQNLLSPAYEASDFMARISDYDCVVALKLHAGILATAANVPSVLLEYQPKTLDYAKSIGWERYTIRTNQLTSEKIIERVLELTTDAERFKVELCRKLCDLAHEFDSYCKEISTYWK